MKPNVVPISVRGRLIFFKCLIPYTFSIPLTLDDMEPFFSDPLNTTGGSL